MKTTAATQCGTAGQLWLMVVATAACIAAMALPATAAEIFFELEADGLEDLGAEWAYEGWAIVDGAPVSAGTFTVDGSGSPSRSRFAVEVGDAGAVTAFVLTIEPVPDADPGPAAVHILAGDFIASTAELTVAHGAALGDDFGAAAGSYILAAPSAGEGGDYRNGIWWLDPSSGPGPALELPELPEGWAYEGWVAGPGGPMSTGRFVMASAADSDRGGISSGPYGTPSFPGQDLVNPATDLTGGYAAVISVEPEPDNSPGPFTLKPLVDADIEDVGGGVLQSMANMASGFPSAEVRLLLAAASPEIAHLRLDLHGLEELGPDFVYEGWLVVGGAPVSSGRFSVSGGVPSQSYFPTPVTSLAEVSTFVLTIEPAQGDDPAPSEVHVIGGDFISGQSALSIGHGAAIGTDFASVMGAYILAAPSAGGAAPYQNGIWWLDPAAGPGPALSLPELPAGWTYEGWVAGQDGPISTGRFRMPSGEDSDGAGPAGGSQPAPPFPGQDFVSPAIDLTTGYAAVISVEPEPDNSPAPFSIKPLMDPRIDDVGAEVLQPMHRNSAGIPSGFAVLLEEQSIAAAAHTGGSNQTVWRTNLDIHNIGSRSQMVVVEWLAADQANLMPERVALTIAPYASVRYADVVAALFAAEGSGALRVLAERDAIGVFSRTFNDAIEGTFGQGIPPATDADVVSFGRVVRLVGLSQSDSSSSGFRTNVGLVNLVASPIEVTIDLFDGSGSWAATVSRTLEAFGQTQVNGILPPGTDIGYAEVWTATPGARFLAYGSVVDNVTGDPTYVAAR
jgi:hypothetical protein